MKTTLYALGKLSNELKTLEDFYTARIQHFQKFKRFEQNFRGIQSEDKLKDRENEWTMKKIEGESNSFLILLDPDGKEMSSKSFALLLDEKSHSGKDLAFFIGGACGFSSEVLQRAHLKLSFSKMTFPHGLFRIMFLEQYYRAWSILRNLPYHKE